MKRLSVSIILILIGCSTKDSSEWTRLVDKYSDYDQKGHYDSAKLFGEQALEQAIQDFPENDIRIAKSYNLLAEMYRELRESDKALPLYNKAIEISKTNNDTLCRVVFYSNLGHFYFGIDDFDSAAKSYKEAILLADKRNDSTDDLIALYYSLALVEIEKNNLGVAKNYLLQATKKTESSATVSSNVLSQLYKDWGRLFLKEGKLDSAFYYLSKSKKEKEKDFSPDHPKFATLYSLFGTYHHAVQQYDSAKKYYEAELSLRQRFDSLSPRHYLTFKNLGQLYIDMGDSVKGIEFKRRATELEAINKNYPQQ